MNFKYSEKLPISEAKNKDLKFLLESKIISNDYKHFYDELPTINKPQLHLVSPDYEDSE